MKKAIYKFNGGRGALLCSGCSRVLRQGAELTKEDLQALRGEIIQPPKFCVKCNLENND